MPDQTRQTTTTGTATGTATATETAARDAQSRLGNQEMADRLKAKKPTHTGIVHFGLNGGAEAENAHLNQLNADQGGSKSIRNQKEQDVLVRGKQRMDLASEAGRTNWLATLGLGPELANKVSAVIANAGDGARDELGQLVEVYIQAETGSRRMDRLVLSGHNVGSAMWGDDNGRVPFETFVELKDIFPKAAGQVRHLLVSACYSGGESQMDTYKAAFPGLQSIMAYTGSSPGTASGGLNHIGKWEKATEKGNGSNVDKDIAKNTRKGENVSTWNATDGYQGDQPTPWYDLDSQLNAANATFARYYDQGQAVTNAQSGELRDYYNLVQRALRHPEAPASMRTLLASRRDQPIRLLFYGLIRERFATKHAAKLAEGYAATGGLALPAYGKLERAAALAAVNALATAVDATPSTAGTAALDLLRRGLVKLDNDLILEQWI